MRIVVTRRGCEISDELRTRARQIVERLAKRSRRPMAGHVMFREDGMERRVDVRLRTASGKAFHAVGAAKDFRTALDRARDKLRRQLEASRVRAGGTR